MNVSSVLLFISFCINVVTNLSYQSRASLRLRDILGSGGDCGSEHFLCDDGNTCCELGGSCCPDPGSNTGTGCCEYDNGVCCEGYCCWQGFVCLDGGCGLGNGKNGTHLVWTQGKPIVSGSSPTTLPP